MSQPKEGIPCHSERKNPPSRSLPYAARRRCRCRHAHLGKQWFSIESSVRITLAVPQLRVYCQPRASVAVLCEASVCTRAALRESRRRRPHRESPLRAAAALWPAHWISQTRPDRSRPATSAPSAELARSRWDNRSALQPPAPTSRRVVQREEWAIAQEPRKR